jgi:hypothetical protein
VILDDWKNEKCPTRTSYFSAYENKNRQAVESLLTDDFVFLPVRTIIALTVKGISNGAGPIPRNPPSYGIERLFEKGNQAFILYNCQIKRIKMVSGSRPEWRPIPEHGIVHHRRQQDKRYRGLFWFCPKGTSVNNDYASALLSSGRC